MDSQICAVMVTFNRVELLREALTALLAQTRPLEHIIVINNASTDNTVQVMQAEFPTVELVNLPTNNGGAAGFYEGIRIGKERGFGFLWLLDDDSIANPTALEELEKSWQDLKRNNVDVGALGNWVVWTDGRPHPMNHPWPDFVKMSQQSQFPEHRLVRWTTFVGAFLPMSEILAAGMPYADYFIWNDDLEYTGRIARKKIVAHVKSSIVVHKTKLFYTPAAGTGERFYYEVRNRIWVLRTNTFRPWEKVMLFWHLVGTVGSYLMANKSKGLAVVRKGLHDGLNTMPRQL